MQLFRSGITAGIGATLAIWILAMMQQLNADLVMLMAPFGASAVLLFAVPESPLAQAKNVIMGHLLTATVGLVFVQFFPVEALTLALATGAGVGLMVLTKTTHPPAGANPLLIMMTGQSWSFLLDPVTPGVLIMVLVARLYHRISARFLTSMNRKPGK